MSPAASPGQPHGQELQKFLQRFLQKVDQAARPLRLNVFKRAKLANSFKWRLREKGVEPQIIDELTQALVLRLSAGGTGATQPNAAAVPGRRRTADSDPALLAAALAGAQ